MRLDPPKNINYAAIVVALKEFTPVPKADRIKSALIFGNSVIVSKNAKEGDIGLFFPVETQLSHEFVSQNNLYRHVEWGNIDLTKTGYLETHRRIKCARFLGTKSEGLWIPISSLGFIPSLYLSDLQIGDTFDKIFTHEICSKYIVGKSGNGTGQSNSKATQLKNSIVDGQFKFHFDTDNLRKNIHKIQPTDYISITDKWHGTSAIYSKPLVLCKLNWFERILRNVGVRIQEAAYGFVYSSRKVVKCVNGTYGTDVWGVVAKEVFDKIPNEFSIYGEIVGYTPQGGAIQSASGGRPYHYGCAKGEHKFVVYRVKTTNVDGKTLELTVPQVRQFCGKYGLQMMHEWYYGIAGDLLDGIATNDGKSWEEQFLAELKSRWVHDQMCAFNNNEVPAEGIVVRIDYLDECQSFKLKNFKFLEDETQKNDAGVLDMETEESEG